MKLILPLNAHPSKSSLLNCKGGGAGNCTEGTDTSRTMEPIAWFQPEHIVEGLRKAILLPLIERASVYLSLFISSVVRSAQMRGCSGCFLHEWKAGSDGSSFSR